MAKRKRLTAPLPGYLDTAPSPETKGMFASPAPIAGVAREASASAAMDEMAQTLTRARQEGRMVLPLPLASVQLDYLVRDRLAVDTTEMDTLVASLRARGQQTPIEVADLGEGRYGLISGWRRCQALKRLADETGAEPAVLALLRRPEQASDAYLAMVEENEIRVGLSYFERARIVARAAQQGVYESEKAALATLFASASRPKRSKIGSFLTIVSALDGALRFPEAIGERLGLALSRGIEDHPSLAETLRIRLNDAAPQSTEAELALLEDGLKAPTEAPTPSLIRPRMPDTPLPETTTEKAASAEDGTLSEDQVDAARTGGREVAPGVWMRIYFNGGVAISGEGVTPELRNALREWLAGTA